MNDDKQRWKEAARGRVGYARRGGTREFNGREKRGIIAGEAGVRRRRNQAREAQRSARKSMLLFLGCVPCRMTGCFGVQRRNAGEHDGGTVRELGDER